MRVWLVVFIGKSWVESLKKESLTKELILNGSGQLFPDTRIRALTIFFRSIRLWLGSGYLYIAIYPATKIPKCCRRKFMFFLKRFSKLSGYYCLVPVLRPSITDTVEAMNMPFQRRHNHSKLWITVEVYSRTQKVEVYFAYEGYGFVAFFNTDLVKILAFTCAMNLGVILKGKWSHGLPLPRNVDRTHSLVLIIYADLI